MPQMMPLWWLLNLTYTSLLLYCYLIFIHYMYLMTSLTLKNKKFPQTNINIKW